MLSAKHLSFCRNDNPIVTKLSFELNEGECLHVAGANGSGKTSLLRILVGLQTGYEGKIFWQNQLASKTYYAQLHYLAHLNGLKSGLTVKENLTWMLQLADQSLDGLQETLMQAGLQPYENFMVQHLSQGWQRRVALFRCQILRKKIWILDEPFNALDKSAITWFIEIMKIHLNQQGMIIFTHHQVISDDLQSLITRRLDI